MPKFMEEFGETIARNGYEVIAIRPGEKRPYGKDWETAPATVAAVRAHIAADRGAYGIGIRTKWSPGIDIDCKDRTVVEHMTAFVTDMLGPVPTRVGLPPKTLLACRTDLPFPKVDSGFWLDDHGRTAKLEILADGQQYVAAHIHPETGKPYRWSGGSPLKVKQADLPEITQEQAEAIRNEFVRYVSEVRGWQRKSGSVNRLTHKSAAGEDVFTTVAAKTEISDEELHNKLLMVPNPEDYDVWFHVGMALWHQYDGGEDGLALWHEWSAEASNYDSDALDKRWKTFDIERKNRQPITARFILKMAKEEESRVRVEELDRVRTKLSAADSLDKLTAVCDEIKNIAFTTAIREVLMGIVKDRFKAVTGTAPRIGIVRDMIRYENPENRRMPHWLKDFVYVQFDKTFYHTTSRRNLDTEAFNASFARLLLTKKDVVEGRVTPEFPASHVALNQYQIPLVYNRMYMPGYDSLFSFEGVDYVNTYSDAAVPVIPDILSAPEREAVRVVEAHFEHLFRHTRDRNLFIDWLAFIIQNPGKRINWAVLLQGTEGDGKSFFVTMLKLIAGWSNINMIRGVALEEKYNPWAEGAMVCFIEDVRLHGNSRFDAINTLKPLITNPTASIRRMNTNAYEVVNTMNYLATANMKDALPIGADDSRFFPLYSRFQSREAILAFKAEHPDYYTRLFRAIKNHAGAIRKWFLSWTIGSEFDHEGRAPVSSDRAEMVALNLSEDEEALRDSLTESGRPDYCGLLLDSGLIADEFVGRDAFTPATKAIRRLLSTNGFTFLGRIKVEGEKRRFWSRNPEAWPSGEEALRSAIREYLDPRGL